jgi:uncharacterized protein
MKESIKKPILLMQSVIAQCGRWRSWLRSNALFYALRRSLLLCLVITLMSCAWLDNKQRQIIYRPTPSAEAEFVGQRPGDRRYFLEVQEPTSNTLPSQRIEMWWLPHADKAAPTLLYFHGTYRHLTQNLPKINALREAGFAVLAVEYRGWGQSSPIIPSEKSILRDAQLAFEELQRLEPRANQRVIYGHSMGSGVAVGVVSKLQDASSVGGMILESAFTSFPDIAGQVGWWGRLLSAFNRERFSSIDKINQVKVPLLMIHGKLDTTVQAVLGRKLFDAASEPKQWLLIENGKHSDLHTAGAAAYQEGIEDFKKRHILGKTPATLGSSR